MVFKNFLDQLEQLGFLVISYLEQGTVQTRISLKDRYMNF